MPFCFVCQQLDELVPSQVSYVSVHRVFVLTFHVLHGQVLIIIVNILKNEEITTMKKLRITKEHFEKSKYFTKKYGNLKFVSESGRVFKTDKGYIIKFSESMSNDDTIKVMAAASATDMDAADMGLISHKKADPYNVLKKNKSKKVDEGMKREVIPMNGRKSFGRKAIEEEDKNGFTLYSYETPVARLERRDDGSGFDFSLLNDYLSTTTLTHIHSWLIGHNQKDIPTKKLLQLPIGQEVPMVAAESNNQKLVKEGAGAGYTVRIKDLKFGKILDKKQVGDSKAYDSYHECKVEILPGEYEIEAEDYYNDFFWQEHEFGEKVFAKIDGGVATIAYTCVGYDGIEPEDELHAELENQEMDIAFDYGWGWSHADLPKDEPIESDHIDVEGREFYGSIDKIELKAPNLAEVVNSGYQSMSEMEDGSNEDEEQVNEVSGWKLEDKDLTLVNSESDGNKLYIVKMWWGSGYQMDCYNAYAFSDEEALEYVVAYIEENNPKWLETTDESAYEFLEELVKDGEADSTDDAYDNPSFQEAFLWVDATSVGAKSGHFVNAENLQIAECPSKR